MESYYLPILLLLAASRIVVLHALDYDHSFQSAIYVDSQNGTPERVCWTGGEKQPCSSLELALEGAQLLNSTVIIRAGKFKSAVSCTHAGSVYIDGTTENTTSNDCPPWSFYNNSTSACECGKNLNGLVYCDPSLHYILVLYNYCMTYDNSDTGTVLVSACPYSTFKITALQNGGTYLSNYHKVLLNSSELSDAMCGDFNREGQLCGQCKEGYYSPAYSYDLQCRNCTYTSYNWAKYFLVAFGPLTIFLFLIFLFRISVTSPPLVAFVLLCQISAAPVLVRFILVATNGDSTANTLARVMTTLYGVWNLDFFRTLLPPICLDLTTLQILALDYVIAFYPLTVIVVAYFIISLYEREYRFIRWLWRPFQRCCVNLRRQWDIKTSIIDVFAAFLFLSIVKFISTSYDILMPTVPYNQHGQQLDTVYLYYNQSVKYFGKEHLPYAILALCIFLLVLIFPLVLLMLYPCKCFQRCLTHCHLHSHVLRTFMDAFQGSLKDGTNGTRDCRYFSAVYLGNGFLLYLVFGIIPTTYVWPLCVMVLVGIAILHVLFQPFKQAIYNNVACITYLIIAMYCNSAMAIIIAGTSSPHQLQFSIILLAILFPLPQLYILGVFMHWLIYKKRILHLLLQKVHIWRPKDTAQIDFQETLPDRLANPEEYERLLADPVREEDNETFSTDTAY